MTDTDYVAIYGFSVGNSYRARKHFNVSVRLNLIWLNRQLISQQSKCAQVLFISQT